MAWNNYFPAGYQPYPMYQQPQMQTAPAQQPQAPRMVEIFPVDGETAVNLFPVANGTSAVLMDKGDAFLSVKSAALDGSITIIYYDKRPPAPPEPTPDFSQYVRRDEIEGLVSAALAAQEHKNRGGADNGNL